MFRSDAPESGAAGYLMVGAPLMIDGAPLDLAHLTSITRQVEIHLPGGFKKIARVDFHFRNHCYSRSPESYRDGSIEAIPSGRLVPDGSKEQPRNRIYCPNRYELSKQLVPCIDAMINTNGIVTRTQHVNYFHLNTLTHALEGIPSPANYYVFFRIKTEKPDNLPKQFNISVESAYVDATASGHAARTFAEALGEEWSGQPVARKKKKKK